MEPWKILFLLWAILSILGIIGIMCCQTTILWILFGVSIVSLIVCIVFYVTVKGILNFYAHVGINDNRYDGLDYANQRENDLNNSRDSIKTNYSDKPDNRIVGERIIIKERDDDNDKFFVYNESYY